MVICRTEAICIGACGLPMVSPHFADVAQLVERNLAKVEVASSNLVVRSKRPFRGEPGSHSAIVRKGLMLSWGMGR